MSSKPRRLCGTFWVSLALLIPLRTTAADINDAVKAYTSSDYNAARAIFFELAQMGSGTAQYNLAIMAMRAEGTAANKVEAVGWMLAAQQNGRDEDPKLLTKLRSELAAEEVSQANLIANQYGKEALQSRLIPLDQKATCSAVQPKKVIKISKPWDTPDDGVVILDFTLGLDGVPHDLEVIVSEPQGRFTKGAAESLMNARFEPARYQGEPIETRERFIFKFLRDCSQRTMGALWSNQWVKDTQEAAKSGDLAALYSLAIAAHMDKSLGIKSETKWSWLLSAAQDGEPRAQYWIASLIGIKGHCESQNKMIPWLEQAAKAGHPAAKASLAERTLRGAMDQNGITRIKALLEGLENTTNIYALKHAAAILAASPHVELRDPSTALKLARQIDLKIIPIDPEIHEVIALTLAANQDFEGAAAEQKQALSRAKKLKWNTSEMEIRLDLYQKQLPWTGNLY